MVPFPPKLSMFSLLFVALSACPGGKRDTSGDAGPATHYDNNPPDTTPDEVDTDTGGSDTSAEGEGEGSSGALSVDAVWTSSGVTFTITNGNGHEYTLGMAETSASDPWTGEDCLQGYTTSSGSVLLYCHPLSATGGSRTTTDSLSDIFDDDDGSGELSTYTLFSSSFQTDITYGLWDSNMDCYTWGSHVAYYAAEGCMNIGP